MNPATRSEARYPRLRALLVGRVYANHNRSAAVCRALAGVLAELNRTGEWGLDAGAGTRRMHPRLFCLDVDRTANPHCLASAEALPLASASLALVISQEVLEHVADPWRAVVEAARVLRPGGRLYLQAPFVIGYHPSPSDYWRFTAEGLRRLIESAGLELECLEPSVGAGSGMYRIAVEFGAVVAASLWARLYLPVKGLAAILLRPLCFLDRLTASSPAAHRIPGGYLAIAVKPSCAS